MFTYSIWKEICLELAKSKKTIKAEEILNQPHDRSWIVIKHDVETNVKKALKLAQIEHDCGIRATYYVQANLLEHNKENLQKIQSLGHEVTYHYDVLDANNGNIEGALREFEKNMQQFNEYGFQVKTVCPHGNPMMNRNGWNSNKDFFRDDSIAKRFANILDIVVQLPYLSNEYKYISDAGYSWKVIVNISNNDIKNDGDTSLKDYQTLLHVLDTTDRVILSTHPHRWEEYRLKFFYNIYFFKSVRFLAKKASKISFLKKIMSRFYFLAKKV